MEDLESKERKTLILEEIRKVDKEQRRVKAIHSAGPMDQVDRSLLKEDHMEQAVEKKDA